MGSVLFFSEEVPVPRFKRNLVKKWVRKLIEQENKKPGEINYVFVSDRKLADIHAQYLNHDSLTDIITFDNSISDNKIDSDIFISTERIEENARLFNTTFHVELFRVMAHGILHLLGFKDKTEDDNIKMRRKEDEALDLLNFLSKGPGVSRET